MLTKPLAVMFNRGGESLETGRSVADTIGWPIIGEDTGDIVICDAGSVMVGFGFKVPEEHLATGQCCSRRFAADVPTDVNPATEMVLVPTDFDDAVPRAAQQQNRAVDDVARSISTARGGQPQLSFFDVNGNLTTLTRPTEDTLNGDDVGSRLRSLLEARGLDVAGAGNPDNPAPLIGVTLLVEDIPPSLRFYRDVLGLTPLREEERNVWFDAGPIILRIQDEVRVGLVKSHRERGLLTDQLIFYVPDIQAEFDNLTARGVFFPEGIEDSVSSGRVAYFHDPDGHDLWLWQPPERYTDDMPFDYFPVLERILQENG